MKYLYPERLPFKILALACYAVLIWLLAAILAFGCMYLFMFISGKDDPLGELGIILLSFAAVAILPTVFVTVQFVRSVRADREAV